MKTRYRIVEEGYSVYLQYGFRFLFFTIWHWDLQYSGAAGNGPREDYRTVENARQEVARRRKGHLPYVDPPRITDCP
jgi:hypothetical protein